MIPDARRDAVQSALRTVFGAQSATDWLPISGGVSGALILRFEISDRSYLLRLEPERIAATDRKRGFACMAAAAEAGVAPKVHYTDAAAGLAIMDFIPSRPLADHPGGPAGLARALGVLAARVHETPPFPLIGDYPDLIETVLAALDASGHFAAGQLDRHVEGLARIRVAYPWDASALVSSHNDPNPRNLLFDGERLWLVDWELAFRNDPLVDVAILTTDLAETPALRDLLFEAAFGRPPDRVSRARLEMMRLLTRLFYGGIVLQGFINGPTTDPGIAEMTPETFRAAVADGRLKSGAPETAYAFGRMSLGAFVAGLRAPGFDEMLKVVAQG